MIFETRRLFSARVSQMMQKIFTDMQAIRR